MTRFKFAMRPTGQPIEASFDDGFLALVDGASGSGKNGLASVIVCSSAQAYGPRVQYVIVSPKPVAFNGFEARCYVETDPIRFPQVLTALLNEVDRRYVDMAAKGLYQIQYTDETPFILLLIDELPMLTANPLYTKQVAKEITDTLTALYLRARQAGVGCMALTQTCNGSVFPTQARASAGERFVLKTASQEEVVMATAGREDEAPAQTLYLPGEGYFLTSTTLGRYVRGRVTNLRQVEAGRILQNLSGDKRYLYCMDWDNPDFAG